MALQKLLVLSKQFATEFLHAYPGAYTFHNLAHTTRVASAAEEIASGMKLPVSDVQVVTIAAWFHDLGYLHGAADHEERSCNIASGKLKAWKIDDKITELILRIIRATKVPQKPNDVLEQVICDADLSHLSAGDFFETSEGLRNEFRTIKNITFETDIDWWRFNVNFLKQHRYWTNYGQTVFTPGKLSNLKKLEARIPQ